MFKRLITARKYADYGYTVELDRIDNKYVTSSTMRIARLRFIRTMIMNVRLLHSTLFVNRTE